MLIKLFKCLIFLPLIFALLFLFSIAHASTKTINGTVIKIFNGDTFKLKHTSYNIRLFLCYAPTTSQPFSEEATNALRNKIFGQSITVKIVGKDTHNRLLGIVYLVHRNINLEMINEGYTWVYKRDLQLHKINGLLYFEAEASAKAKKLGLWQQDNPQPPWYLKSGKLE